MATATTKAPELAKADKPFKFQVMGGAHYEGTDIKVYKRTADGLEDLVAELACDADFRLNFPQGLPLGYRKVSRDVAYGPKRPDGDIVESDLELDKMFNRNGSKKYQRLGADNNAVSADDLRTERIGRQEAENRYRKALARMSVRELIDLAEADGVELRGNTKKDEVTAILLAAAGITPLTGPSS